MNVVKQWVWYLVATIAIGVLGLPAIAAGVVVGIARRGFAGGLSAADELLDWWAEVGES